MKNYYHILSVPQSASASSIRKAYRKKALELHPDKNKAKDAQERFIELTEAYEVLKSASRKKQYDNLLASPSPKRSSTVERNANKGKKRGKRYSKQSRKKMKRRTDRWDWFDWLILIAELFTI